MASNYSNIYTFCAVNTGYHLLDLSGDIVCYGSASNVILYSLPGKKVVQELKGHSDEVNSVRFFGNDRKYIVSSSSDKTVIVWSKITETEYEIRHTLRHNNSVTIAEAIECDDKLYVLTSTRDKTFRIWADGEAIFDVQEKHFTFDIKSYNNLRLFPGLIILQANSDGKVLFQRFDPNTRQLQTLTIFTGHSDWIRAVDLYQNEVNGTLFIATGSQDFSARVYSIFELIQEDDSNKILHKPTFNYNDKEFMTECVTILYTHDLWINSVKWFKNQNGTASLLTASSDRSIVLWQEQDSSGELTSSKVWQETARFGEFGGVQMGFNGCVVNGNGTLVIGYNHLGAVGIWKQRESIHEWEQAMSITGHYGNVTDLVWEPRGEYFLTCSEDRTTRLHSKLKNGDSWHEIARTQVHGHALKCLALAGPVKLISGAEEKLLRVFSATKYFMQCLKNICGIDLMQNRNLNDTDMAEYATIPALGLSNSAVFQSNPSSNVDIAGDSGNEAPQNDSNQRVELKVLDQPPVEEALEQNTLWPEVRKLYGHGFELFSLAVNSKATLAASACRAQSLKHAVIIIWDLTNYEILLQLGAHNLTITQLQFSPDDRFLLSVSRDRTWNLWNMEKDTEKFGERVAFFNLKTGGHSRIIWDAAWISDSKSFVTVARDQKAILWNIQDNLMVEPNDQVLTLGSPITSVDILRSSKTNSNAFIAAFGLENGKVELHEFDNDKGWTLLSLLENSSHTAIVNRVRFSPKMTEIEGQVKKALLASCGSDRAVKLIEIEFD